MKLEPCVASFVLVALAALSCRPSKSDVVPLVDARLVELGLLAAGGADAGGSGSAVKPSSAPPKDPVTESLLFLARLDDLMKDYKPVLPPTDDSSDLLRCITSDALTTDPTLQRSASALEGKRQASERRRRSAAESFLRDTVPLQYRIDYGWKERGAKAPPLYACSLTTTYKEPAGLAPETQWLDNLSTKTDCEGSGDDEALGAHGFAKFHYARTWKLKAPEGAFLYTYSGTTDSPTNPPELMKRMDDGHIVALDRFTCRVADVFSSGTARFVSCSTGILTPAALRVAGKPLAIHVGDIVSVPLAGTKRDPTGVLSKADVSRVTEKVNAWVVDADAASVVVDHAAVCPSTEEILAAAKR